MAVKQRTLLTDEERAQCRERDREYARKAVEQLRSSEGWKAWLAARASFHSHSALISSRGIAFGEDWALLTCLPCRGMPVTGDAVRS